MAFALDPGEPAMPAFIQYGACVEPELRVVFRRQPTDDAALANIRARFADLTRLADDIVRCHVDVDERGRVFVQLTLLRGDVVRSYDDECKDSTDVLLAIDHAFELLALRLRGRSWSGHPPRSQSPVH